ncbi:hypothetical protein YC2023_012620 [Brassica napus]
MTDEEAQKYSEVGTESGLTYVSSRACSTSITCISNQTNHCTTYMVISFHDFLHTARLLNKRRRDFKKAKSRSPPKVSQREFTSKGNVILFSTARTTPSFVFTQIFVEPSCKNFKNLENQWKHNCRHLLS